MTLAFLELPAGERKVYIDEAAARRGLAPVIVEKDFWVCWLLGILFQSSFRDAIVFKGGTSLSKVFGVINRFSEDIDLSLAPAFLGLDEPEATAALSKGQAGKWMERAEAKCTTVVRDVLAPEIAAALVASLTLHQLRHRGSSRAPRLCGRGLRRRSVACVELSVKSTSHDSATWPRRESKERCLRANVRRSRGTLRGVPQVQTRSASSTTSTSGSCQTPSSLPMSSKRRVPASPAHKTRSSDSWRLSIRSHRSVTRSLPAKIAETLHSPAISVEGGEVSGR
jgi:Nucleotidyl transferase AbiEii toxin, Type IV TA system